MPNYTKDNQKYNDKKPNDINSLVELLHSLLNKTIYSFVRSEPTDGSTHTIDSVIASYLEVTKALSLTDSQENLLKQLNKELEIIDAETFLEYNYSRSEDFHIYESDKPLHSLMIALSDLKTLLECFCISPNTANIFTDSAKKTLHNLYFNVLPKQELLQKLLENNIKTTFVYKLKQLLQSRELSQARLASKLGIKPQTVSEWCHYKSMPSVMVILDIADILCVSVDYLLQPKEVDQNKASVIPSDYLGLDEHTCNVLTSINNSSQQYHKGVAVNNKYSNILYTIDSIVDSLGGQYDVLTPLSKYLCRVENLHIIPDDLLTFLLERAKNPQDIDEEDEDDATYYLDMANKQLGCPNSDTFNQLTLLNIQQALIGLKTALENETPLHDDYPYI
ncbi:MAG: helix-turn-helix transcriptional regulator [Anaerovoracaceae bacterium]